MPGTGATLTSIRDSSLIPKFERTINFALNKMTNVARLATKSARKPVGRTFNFPIQNRRPMSGTSLPPGAGSIPGPATSRNFFAQIYPGTRISTLMVDWEAQKFSSDLSGSVMDIQEEDLMSLTEGERLERERMFCAPTQGTLVPEYVTVTITAIAPVLTFTVSDNDLLPYFADGRRFELWACTGGGGATSSAVANTAAKRATPADGYYTVDTTTEGATSFTVTCVEPSAGGLVVNDTTHCPAAHNAIQEDMNPTGPVNMFTEWHSIDTIISNQNQVLLHTTHGSTLPADATFQGQATGGVWSSPTLTATGAYLNRELVERAGNLMLVRGGGEPGKLKHIIASPFQIEKHLAILSAQERYNNTGKPQQFTSGTQWTYDGDLGPMIGDRQCVKARFLRKDAVFLMGPDVHSYIVSPFEFRKGDDGIWYRDGQNRPADRATAMEIGNFGCDLRNTNVAIRALAVT